MTDIYVLQKRGATSDHHPTFYNEITNDFVPYARLATKYNHPGILAATRHDLIKSSHHPDCTPDSLVGQVLSSTPIREPDNR